MIDVSLLSLLDARSCRSHSQPLRKRIVSVDSRHCGRVHEGNKRVVGDTIDDGERGG